MQKTLLESVDENLKKSRYTSIPFSHWIYERVFPDDIIDELLKLPFQAPKIDHYTGKRESNNQTRIFFNKENSEKFKVIKSIVEVFNNYKIIKSLENICGGGRSLTKGKLRIEYTMDTGDFWLEPHLDIKEKLLTFLVYLSKDTGSNEWGTTIYNSDKTFHSKVTYKSNLGLMFNAGTNSWHGVSKQNIEGVRKNLIINYVVDEWKSIHELAPVI
jgi:hypothetical protein